MATLLSDNFDRANSTTVIGAPQIGPAPVVQSGAGGISSNQLYCTTVQLRATWELGTPNVELSMVTMSLSLTVWILLGYVNVNDYWAVGFQSGSAVTLSRRSPGGENVVVSSSMKIPVSSGTACKAHYRDGVIRVYVDGVLVIRWTVDVPLTGTAHGLSFGGATNPKVDSLLAVDAPVITEPDKPGGLAGPVKLVAPQKIPQSSVYRGRDTKIQDETAGA